MNIAFLVEPIGIKWARRVAVAAGLAVSAVAGARAQSVIQSPTTSDSTPMQLGDAGIRPEHLWSIDYASLVVGDTISVFTAPSRWGGEQWLEAAGAISAVAATEPFDGSIRRSVQAHRTAGEDRFMVQWQEFGNYYAFGALAAFDAWGEIGGDITAKNAAMDGIASSIIAGGLITPALKIAVGRERPSTTTSTYRFKPFGSNASFPSGHATEAFAVATSIAENYRVWWVQVLAYGTAGLVGYARIEQNAHFASDVVAGSLVGWSVARGVVHRNDGPSGPRKLTWTPYANGNGFGIVFFKAF